jgi:hypothetical protein
MVAVKTALADTDTIGTLIFDEIDAGIGGEVALSVGEHLHVLAKRKQVVCITHLASIAVRADTHYRVEKSVQGDRTVTRLVALAGERPPGRSRVCWRGIPRPKCPTPTPWTFSDATGIGGKTMAKITQEQRNLYFEKVKEYKKLIDTRLSKEKTLQELLDPDDPGISYKRIAAAEEAINVASHYNIGELRLGFPSRH